MLRGITKEQYSHDDYNTFPVCLTYAQIAQVLTELHGKIGVHETF